MTNLIFSAIALVSTATALLSCSATNGAGRQAKAGSEFDDGTSIDVNGLLRVVPPPAGADEATVVFHAQLLRAVRRVYRDGDSDDSVLLSLAGKLRRIDLVPSIRSQWLATLEDALAQVRLLRQLTPATSHLGLAFRDAYYDDQAGVYRQVTLVGCERAASMCKDADENALAATVAVTNLEPQPLADVLLCCDQARIAQH